MNPVGHVGKGIFFSLLFFNLGVFIKEAVVRIQFQKRLLQLTPLVAVM